MPSFKGCAMMMSLFEGHHDDVFVQGVCHKDADAFV